MDDGSSRRTETGCFCGDAPARCPFFATFFGHAKKVDSESKSTEIKIFFWECDLFMAVTKRIFQLAKEFERDEKEIMAFLTTQGIKVSNRLSAVSEETYNMLKTKFTALPEPEPEPEPPPKPEPIEQPAAKKKNKKIKPRNPPSRPRPPPKFRLKRKKRRPHRKLPKSDSILWKEEPSPHFSRRLRRATNLSSTTPPPQGKPLFLAKTTSRFLRR